MASIDQKAGDFNSLFSAIAMISSIPSRPSNLTNLQERKLMKLFSMYDADNTGILKVHNFQTLVDRLAALRHWKADSPEYTRLSDKFMYRWFHIKAEIKDKLCEPKTSSIGLNEWILFYSEVLKDTSYRDHIYELVNLIFDAVDTDASGQLCIQEWRQLFQVYGIPVIYAQESFESIDTDRDQHLTKDEVLQRIEEFYYSQDSNAPGNFMFGPL